MARGSNRARTGKSRDGDPVPELDPTGGDGNTVYTMAEAAALKGVSYHTVSRAVRRGKLNAQRLGRMALISAEDLRAWEPMRERAPHKYRRRSPNPEASPALVDLTMKDRVSLALELSTFFELLHEAAVELPLPDFLTLVIERLAVSLDLKRVVVWAIDEDGRTGRRLAAYGPPVSDYPESAPLRELPLLQYSLELDQIAVVPWSTFEASALSWRVHHLGNILLAPLRIGDRLRGALLGDRDGEEFELSEDQLALARGLVNQAALALDRARLLEAERDRGDQLAAILENVTEAVFASDATGRLSVINAAGRALIGVDQEMVDASDDLIEMVNKVQRRTASGELIPPDQVPLVRAARGEVVKDQRHFVVAVDGTASPVSVSAQPILGPNGELRGAVAVARGISVDELNAEVAARKMTRLEAAAAHSGAVADLALAVNAGASLEETLRAAIEKMVLSLGGQSGAIYFQEGDERLVPQVTISEPAGWPVLDPGEATAIMAAIARRQPEFLAVSQTGPAEQQMFAAQDAQAVLIVPLIAEAEVIGAAVISYDADHAEPAPDALQLAGELANQCAVAIEKSRLLERIESAHRRLLAVVDNLPLGVIIVEAPGGRLVLANQAAEELVGGSLPEIVLGSLEFQTAEGLPIPADENPLAVTLSTGQGRFGENLVLARADGTLVRVLANHVPVRDSAGRVVGAVSVLQDVAQLQALDQAKDEFLSITAHELRNPLTSLHGNLQLMLRRMQGDPDREDDRKRLESILAQSDRLGRLVSRLLDVSRAEMGRLDLALAETDAVAVVRRTVDAARGLSTAHNLHVVAPGEVVVVWDEVRIEQVLTNLVSNAIKYSPGGTVQVTVEETEDDWVRVGVQDEGPGIPEHLRLSLFDRYVRGRRRGQQEGSGLGLGLYISRLIAQAHGGDLVATNAAGGGALFILTLPRTAGTAPPSGQQAVSTTA